MADGCDDPRQIDELTRLVERGVVVAAASRYMPGGQQVGGPCFKRFLSKNAGRSLYWFARIGTRDATNSFKAYNREFVESVGIDSRDGFEIGLELTAKARRLRLPVAEIPTIWLDRPAGVSNFKLAKWIPKYLRWYRFAFGQRLHRSQALHAGLGHTITLEDGVTHEGSRQRLGRLHRRLRRRGTAQSRPRGRRYRQLLEVRQGREVLRRPPELRLRRGRRPRHRPDDQAARWTATTSSRARRSSAASRYFHTYAYDLLAENERIIASSCDAAIKAHEQGKLKKVTYLSSSMVFESATHWPSAEGDERKIPPPLSSYGFQKLAVEYFAIAAWDQYKLPYTIVRPFNCVGIGESRALGDVEIDSGNVKLAMSHVVPDLVQKVLKGQDPLHILGTGEQVRHYTYGGDLARGIVECVLQDAALNDDFNLSTAESTTVLDLAELIWKKINGRQAVQRHQRRGVRVRRAEARAGRDEGQERARLRGHDHPRRRCSTRSSRGSSRP